MVLFDDLIYSLADYGVADVLLPFLLIFLVVFAVLEKSKVLGDDSRRFNVVLALIMGLSVVFQHMLGWYQDRSIVQIILAALPQVSLILVAIIMFLILVGVFAKDVEFAGASITGWMVMFALLAVIVIFGNAANWFELPYFLYFLEEPGVQETIVAILVIGLLIKYITGDSKKENERELGKGLKDFGKAVSDFVK